MAVKEKDMDWRPKCSNCVTTARMISIAGGFRCISCQNAVDYKGRPLDLKTRKKKPDAET